jgi:hypothetical protein
MTMPSPAKATKRSPSTSIATAIWLAPLRTTTTSLMATNVCAPSALTAIAGRRRRCHSPAANRSSASSV